MKNEFENLTDFEALQDNSSLGVTDYDIYHVTLGAARRSENSEIGFGLVYSFSNDSDLMQPESFKNPTESGLLTGITEESEVSYDALSIILGYTYFID